MLNQINPLLRKEGQGVVENIELDDSRLNSSG